MGSGSGVLGLLLTHNFTLNLTQIDIQEINQEINIINARVNNITSNVICDDFLEFETDEKFDFIVSNPPFYNSSWKSENEHIKISRYEDNLPLQGFIKKVNKLLTPKGEFIFCYDAREFDKIVLLCSEFKLKIVNVRFVHSKIDNISKLVFIRAKKSSKSPICIESPLIVNVDGNFSDEIKSIYKKVNLHSIKF